MGQTPVECEKEDFCGDETAEELSHGAEGLQSFFSSEITHSRRKSLDKSSVCNMPCTQQQADKVSNCLKNNSGAQAAKESYISLRRCGSELNVTKNATLNES